MGIRIPDVLAAILDATAVETAAKARITGLRKVLETEARRRFAEEGAAPTWKARGAGVVRYDAPGDWSATIADADTFASYVAERHPDEATAVLRLKVTDLEDALRALDYIGLEHQGARVEVAPKFVGPYLDSLIVDVEETAGDDGTVDRVIRVTDPATGELVDGVTATRSNAAGKLVVTLDRDRRREVLEAAQREADALVAKATGNVIPAEFPQVEPDSPLPVGDNAPGPGPFTDERGREVTIEEALGVGEARARHATAGGGFTTPEEELKRARADLGREPTIEDLERAGIVRPASSLVASEEEVDQRNDALVNLLKAREAMLEAERVGHRPPYVGEGADGARRSAEIDRTEAEGYDVEDPRHDERLASADRWEAQAAELARTEEAVGWVDSQHGDAPEEAEQLVDDHSESLTTRTTEAALNAHSREALRKVARTRGISAGGTKPALIDRLVDAGITLSDLEEVLA